MIDGPPPGIAEIPIVVPFKNPRTCRELEIWCHGDELLPDAAKLYPHKAKPEHTK